MSDELRVKFWGVRGSYPTPGAGTVKYGGIPRLLKSVQANEQSFSMRERGSFHWVANWQVDARSKSCCCSAICITITHRGFRSLSRRTCRMRDYTSLGPVERQRR